MTRRRQVAADSSPSTSSFEHSPGMMPPAFGEVASEHPENTTFQESHVCGYLDFQRIG
jgi:hypothetical protein